MRSIVSAQSCADSRSEATMPREWQVPQELTTTSRPSPSGSKDIAASCALAWNTAQRAKEPTSSLTQRVEGNFVAIKGKSCILFEFTDAPSLQQGQINS